jgi:dipeptide transport system substrate-binding protein
MKFEKYNRFLKSTGIIYLIFATFPPLTLAAGKTLIYCSEGSPENFYPGINTTGTSQEVNAQIYDTLIGFELGSTKITPALAEKWSISKDGLEYTLHLRQGVKFHSNKNFTPKRDFNADDVVFMMERQWKENNPYYKVTSSNHAYFIDTGLNNNLKSVEKINDHTVKITLELPDAPFITNLAMPFTGIQSKEYADAMLKAGTPEKIDQEPLGTGPFQLVQYQKDSLIRYKTFVNHWAGRAKVDNLIFAITPDPSVRWAKLKKGECHIMPYPNPADIPAMRQDPQIQVLQQAGLNIGYLAYNTTKKPFTDVRVRKALNMAIDKQAIIDAVYIGTAMPAINPIPPALWSYNKSIQDDAFNPEAAKKLLAQAGYPNGFSTDLWAMPVSRPYSPNAKRIAELMQADFAKIGVKAEIKSYEWGEYRKRMQNGEHQMGLFGWTADSADPDNFLHTMLGCDSARGNGSNVAKFCYLPFDDVILEAKHVTKVSERTSLYEKAQLIFKQQAPWLTIAHATQTVPIRKDVQNYQISPLEHKVFRLVDLQP